MRIVFVGDVMLGRLVNEVLKKEPPEYPWGDTLPIFKNADLRICNLECVLSDIGEPFPREKVFHFRTDEKNIKTLLAADIGIVSLANNHVLDYGYSALLRMIKVLGEHAINYAGAGLDILEAKEPAICSVDSQNVGFIAFTDNEPEWAAEENKPGIFYVTINEQDRRAQQLFEIIQKTRDDVDLLIASAHWGPNWGYRPPKEHISFAHHLIDVGADIVFGHSPHVFRGIEIYKNKVILYSTGDFIDDYAVDEIERNDESFIFYFETNRNNITRLILYPTIINFFQARCAKERGREIANKMQNLCFEFATKTMWHDANNFLEVYL
ncbi:MAG: hypothetical protein KatS3mg089_0333 [Patescibacteria group bacterium]|nr:MAG: hypothetical protein KatS3mg089_0333 [Patescibacteria group bacterium]